MPALNVTTRSVNMAKMGAMKAFLNRAHNDRLRTKPLDECFAAKWRDDGTCANVCNVIVETYEDFVEAKVWEAVDNQQLAEALVDNMCEVIDKMAI